MLKKLFGGRKWKKDTPQRDSLFGHEVIGYVAGGDVELPENIRLLAPISDIKRVFNNHVEVDGFRPGAGTHILGIIPDGRYV